MVLRSHLFDDDAYGFDDEAFSFDDEALGFDGGAFSFYGDAFGLDDEACPFTLALLEVAPLPPTATTALPRDNAGSQPLQTKLSSLKCNTSSVIT